MKSITPTEDPVMPNRPWNAAKAARVLQLHARSGLTLAAFARRHDVSVHSLYAWRRELNHTQTAGHENQQVAFLPVELAKPVAPPKQEPPSVEVVLSGGTMVRIKGAVDLAQMKAVLRAVQEATC